MFFVDNEEPRRRPAAGRWALASGGAAGDNRGVHHRPSIALLLALAVAACGQSPGATDEPGAVRLPLEPVTRLTGELHLHQFPLGAHAWAAFVAEPIPVEKVNGDQLFSLGTAVTASEGACRLWRRPRCPAGCAPGTYCTANDTCTPVVNPAYIDGGAIRVTGSRVKDPIQLWFEGAQTSYRADPPPGQLPLFGGGELLRIDGGSGATRLQGVLAAPAPLTIKSPAPDKPLHLPQDDALPVTWDPGVAALVVVAVSASTAEGDWANIRCVGPDAGQLTVPPSLMGMLPPPPRTIRLEVERDNEVLLKTVTPGVGLLTHAAFSAWINGSDP